MNEHTRWRLAFARDICERLGERDGLRAVVVGGSVARGYSDPYSDLELLLFWDAPPDSAAWRAIMADLDADFRLPEAYRSNDSALLIRGVPVDLWPLTVSGEEAVLDRVFDGYSIALEDSSMVDTLRTCLPLSGEGLIGRWQARTERYPDALALAFLRAYLPHFHLRQLHLAAHRDNPTAFYHTLTDVQCSLFIVLLALNRTHFPTFKWIYQRFAELPLAPAQIAPRLRQMFHEPPPRAAEQLHALLSETLALVEEHYPQLDPAVVAWAWHGMAQRSTPLAAPPGVVDGAWGDGE